MSIIYKTGQAIHFHHLHDDRASKCIAGPDEYGEYTFLIEGKVRRMIIVGLKPRIFVETANKPKVPSEQNQCFWYEAKGKLAYLVVSVQSNEPFGAPSIKLSHLMEQGKSSYVVLKPVVYPAESVAQGAGQKPTSIRKSDFDQIINELNYFKLGYHAKWDRS